VANSVEAVHCGAEFIDSTLYGLGRSAGNVPTEVAVAVFKNLGWETGVDLFAVMDAAEEFIGPMMSQMQLYDMMSVAMGYSQFHSSFLPKAAAAARKHGVELRRLVAAMGKFDPVNLDDENLERAARNLPKVTGERTRATLISFAAPGISGDSISGSLQSVRSLVEGMTVTCAKRRARLVLELVPSESESEDLVLADLVLAEGPAVLGRVVYGSFAVLENVLRLTSPGIPFYLLDLDGGAWGREWPDVLQEIVAHDRILPVHSKRLFAGYLADVVTATAHRCGDFCLFIYGSPDGEILQHCATSFKHVAVYGELPPSAPANCLSLEDFSDSMHFNLGITAALILCPPSSANTEAMDGILSSETVVITAGHFPRLESELPSRAVVRVDPNHAYRGQMDRWIAISNLMKSAQLKPLAMQ